MKVLVTGNAGFIGFHVARALMARGDAVVGIDVVNDYYDPGLKEARLAALGRAAAETGAAYEFRRADLADRAAVEAAFADHRFDRVINLAAQAGVRYSLENPLAYVQSNLVGFTHLLDQLYGQPWVVYAKRPCAGPTQVLEYLGRAISTGWRLPITASWKCAMAVCASRIAIGAKASACKP